MNHDARYKITRYYNGTQVVSMSNLVPTVAFGIIELIWGTVPETLVSQAEGETEWNLHLGGGCSVVVERTA